MQLTHKQTKREGDLERKKERERERERGGGGGERGERERERERNIQTERVREWEERVVNMILRRSPHTLVHHYRFDETKTHVSLYAAVCNNW